MSMVDMKICTIILPFLAIFLVSYVHGLGPRIIEPYPDNVYAIENEKTKVTCVVEDQAADPDKIVFVRKTRFGDILPIYDEGPGGRIYYQNETLENGKKMRVTLHFNKVVKEDDSRRGGYECQGFTGSNQHEYGFTVTVIEREELPGIEVSNNVSANFGDRVELSCNLTIKKGGSADQTKLTKLMWAKEGKVIEQVLYPREQSLKSLKIDVDNPEKGGVYTCHLTSKLRNVKEHNITDNIYVSVKPKFFAADLKDNKLLTFKGDSAKFVCSAKGNPLKTEWKKQTKNDEKVDPFSGNLTEGEYKFHNMDKLEGHTLSISEVQYSNRGKYYCCIKDSNNSREATNIEDCQVFTLRVKDPLGALWPVIGIIIEAILLVIILVVSEKYKKKKKNKSTRADDRVDFSYSSTDDAADKGHVRLRPSAATAPSEEEKA